ncbi:30S ribosomal protein S6 [Azospirillum griseum]|uniref:Small ribosomal subunit protein bS6 n=1 Tax=Azospirillum griseum TaxID=2496639 RepID=A0A431VIM8_9PROT|nr:30S ribosomal protein S6 [Azospirillum griseum]RTR21425.1 30S ribosomal protein S6 [Azospirillum griseum]
MALYECVLIARQDISAAQAETLSEQFAQIIRDNGGTVAKTEYWGLKTLTYKVKKNRKGHYTLFNLDAPAAAVAEMERNMSINEDVLRYMTVRVDALDPNPSAMMQSRNERSDRGDRGDRGPRRFDDRGPRGPRRQDTATASEGEIA